MRMPDAFSEKADFSGIDGKEDLFVSAVLHQAVLDVSETGAEALAATGIVIGIKGLIRPTHTIKVDRPFYVMLRDRKSGAMLLVAHVRTPKE